MIDYKKFFSNSINNLIQNNFYRSFVAVDRDADTFPISSYNGKKVTVWCSNDYLGMGTNKSVINACIEAAKTYGVGSGGTRNISGTNSTISQLEAEIASLHQKEAALTFTSGYVANNATIEAFGKIIPNLIIFSDEKNHASIISGIKASRLEKIVFKHNDMADLEQKLKSFPDSTPKIIIIESVYSMDGTIGKINDVIDLAQKYNCLTYVDEVHAVGIYGKNGGGIIESLGVGDKIDIIQGTFGKAFGSIGGYIAANKEIVDGIRSFASGFIFTTSLPPIIAAAVTQSIKFIRTNPQLRELSKSKVAQLKQILSDNNIPILKNDSHIIIVPINNAAKAKEASLRLLNEYGIYIQHIAYPTVAIGFERLRITVTPLHTEEMIKELAQALKEVLV